MNPYENLLPESFWKLAVSNRSMFDIADLWNPKFHIEKKHKVSTYGSCFAQHIGKALKAREFSWLITENVPIECSYDLAKQYNYKVFTSRTGNIYTTSLLKQWTEWALGKKDIPDEVWEKNGRFYDPFRPRVEPDGFFSVEELRASLKHTVMKFRESIVKSDYFVFTLGLTESWFNSELGYEYPMCPGTVAGFYDGSKHKFRNQEFEFVLTNLSDAIHLMREINPKLRFILTVSPVPLTATNSQKHVLVSTMESKSILRSVAGQLANNREYIDYFPSYEIINSPVFKGVFFEPNQRNVNPRGVDFVMGYFFNGLSNKFHYDLNEFVEEIESEDKEDKEDNCEEALLEAFGK